MVYLAPKSEAPFLPVVGRSLLRRTAFYRRIQHIGRVSAAAAYYTPGSGEHGNPVFNRGSGGGARGCGFEERVGVYARTEGGHFLYPFCPCVCVCVVKQPLVSKNGLRERLRVCRGGSRNQLRGLKEGGSARRGAMLCLSADLTTHAGSVKT